MLYCKLKYIDFKKRSMFTSIFCSLILTVCLHQFSVHLSWRYVYISFLFIYLDGMFTSIFCSFILTVCGCIFLPFSRLPRGLRSLVTLIQCIPHRPHPLRTGMVPHRTNPSLPTCHNKLCHKVSTLCTIYQFTNKIMTKDYYCTLGFIGEVSNFNSYSKFK